LISSAPFRSICAFLKALRAFSKRLEFLVLYGAGYGIVHEVMTFRAQKWQTVFFSSCYGVIVALMVSIAALMWWRQPFDEQQFIMQQ